MWPTSTSPNIYTALEYALKPSFRSITNLLIYINAIFVWNFSFWDITLYYYGIFILLALSSHSRTGGALYLIAALCRCEAPGTFLLNMYLNGNIFMTRPVEDIYVVEQLPLGNRHQKVIKMVQAQIRCVTTTRLYDGVLV